MLTSLIGGAFIGIAATIILVTLGRVFGISGIIAGLMQPDARDRIWRLGVLSGFLAAGVILRLLLPETLPGEVSGSPIMYGLSGLLVGVGTQLGSGCTSGHGVCGISRGSRRSITATVIFMATGIATVSVMRYILGIV